MVEDRVAAVVELDEVAGVAGDAGALLADALVDDRVVDDDAVDVLRHPVADDPHDEVGLLVDAARRGEVAARGLHVLVGAEEDAQVLHERAVRGALAGGAHDEAAVLRDELLEAVEDLLEALALLGVADLARDAAQRAAALRAVAGHEDEVAAGDRERGGDARTLRADWPFGDLDRHDRAGGEALAISSLVRRLPRDFLPPSFLPLPFFPPSSESSSSSSSSRSESSLGFMSQ